MGCRRQEARNTRCRSEPNYFRNQSHQGSNCSKNKILKMAGCYKVSHLFLTTIHLCVQHYTRQQSVAQAGVPFSLPTRVH